MQQLGPRRAQTVRRASTTMLVRVFSAKTVRLATFLKHSLRRVLSALLDSATLIALRRQHACHVVQANLPALVRSVLMKRCLDAFPVRLDGMMLTAIQLLLAWDVPLDTTRQKQDKPFARNVFRGAFSRWQDKVNALTVSLESFWTLRQAHRRSSAKTVRLANILHLLGFHQPMIVFPARLEPT